jgi:hypothetical protein
MCFGFAVFASRFRVHVRPAAQVLEYPLVFLLITVGVVNLVLAAGFFFTTAPRVRNLVAWGCVIPISFALLVTAFLVSEYQLRLSPVVFAGQLLDSGVPVDRLFVYRGMGRNLRYGLSFYLHREVLDWDQNPNTDAYIISDRLPCADLNREAVECLPISLGSPHQWFVAHVTPRKLAGSSPDSGQPH